MDTKVNAAEMDFKRCQLLMFKNMPKHGSDVSNETIFMAFVYQRNKTRGPLVLYRSPECWGYVKICGYWETEV